MKNFRTVTTAAVSTRCTTPEQVAEARRKAEEAMDGFASTEGQAIRGHNALRPNHRRRHAA